MSDRVFLDTNGLLALLHKKDAHHNVASEMWFNLGARGYDVVLTDWIIAETGNGLARTRIRGLFADTVDRILNSPKVEVVNVDSELLAKAVDHYRRYSDKSWGLIDCSSFVVMQERGITEALTSDRHFQQAGFVCLIG